MFILLTHTILRIVYVRHEHPQKMPKLLYFPILSFFLIFAKIPLMTPCFDTFMKNELYRKYVHDHHRNLVLRIFTPLFNHLCTVLLVCAWTMQKHSTLHQNYFQ